MYLRLDDFFRGYQYQSESTMKIFSALTDQTLGQQVAEGHRNLGQIAWHIVTSAVEMMNRTGLGLSSVGEDDPPPRAAAEILSGYQAVSRELVDAIKEKWNDGTLKEMDDMYGDRWPRGLTLEILLRHETHHRGQMTVLLRQAGQKVPGIFGPSKEEWAQHGMEAPPY